MKARSQTLLICVMLLVTGSVAAAGTVTKKPFGQTRDVQAVELNSDAVKVFDPSNAPEIT